ncbi:2S seed storage protein 5 [Linum perenne]
MAKLTLSLAAIAAAFLFLIVVDASVRTTVIIDEEDANQGRGEHQGGRGGSDQQRCQHEIQQQDNLRNCQEFIRQLAQQMGQRDEEYYYNQGRGGQGQQGQQFNRCCDELRELSTECTCRGVEKAMSQVQQQLRGQEKLEQVREMVQGLPGRCGTSPSRCGGRSVAAWL